MDNKQALSKAFCNAFNGAKYFFRHERNGKIQSGIALIVLALAFALNLSLAEWAIILLCIGVVLGLEMINSAMEKLCDLVYSDYHPTIKIIKDVSAAAVLWTSAISTVVACIIFIPKIMAFLS